MTLDDATELCKDLGCVIHFRKNTAFWGNIDLEIITPHKTKLFIASDRGEWLCYVKKELFGIDRLVPLGQVLKTPAARTFPSLPATVDFIKANLHLIEKKHRHRKN